MRQRRSIFRNLVNITIDKNFVVRITVSLHESDRMLILTIQSAATYVLHFGVQYKTLSQLHAAGILSSARCCLVHLNRDPDITIDIFCEVSRRPWSFLHGQRSRRCDKRIKNGLLAL